MGRLIALQFNGWPQQSNPPPAVDANAERQAAGARGGAAAGRGGGSIWALDGLLEPVAVRFRFHFEEERPTNRLDRECVPVGFAALLAVHRGVCSKRHLIFSR